MMIFLTGGYQMNMTIESIRNKLSSYTSVRDNPEGRFEAAVALVLVPEEDGLELLLIKRTEREDDPWSGQIALPGGRIEEEDGDLLDTAIRETFEETAVDLTRGELLGELDDLCTTNPLLPPMLVRPFVFRLEQKQAVTPNEEVSDHFWISLETLLGSRVTEELEVRGYSLTVKGFRFGPNLVWGMTNQILTHFRELIRQE
jgi:8-oxo-dGTP pyrophosphatase MutT (NUDIX family)